MRLYLIIDETCFYHPDFVARFFEQTKDTVVGAALVTKVSPKSNIDLYLKRHWYYLHFYEIVKLVFEKVNLTLKDIFLPKRKGGNFYSVKSVLECFNIKYMEVEYNINQPQYLDKIKETQPDVIISSNSLIFGKTLLRMPKICCINRHSALLPAYGGLFPVLQAYRCAEEKVGASVHMMEEGIDTGAVIAQKEIMVQKNDTIATLYQKCFSVSVDVLLEALEKIRVQDTSPYINKRTSSYFSFPIKEHWDEFRKRGGRFI